MNTRRLLAVASLAVLGLPWSDARAGGPRVSVGVTVGGPPVPYYRPYPPPFYARPYPPPFYYPRPYYGMYAVPPPVIVVQEPQPTAIYQQVPAQPTVIYQQVPAPAPAAQPAAAAPTTSAYPTDRPPLPAQTVSNPTPTGLPLPPPPAPYYPPVGR